MTSFNFNLKSEYLANAYHNEDFYKASIAPQHAQPNIQLQITLGDKAATFYFLVNRAIQTHELTAVTPLPETDFGKYNAMGMQRLDIAPADWWAANYELDIDGPEVYGFSTVTQSNARCYWLTVWEIIE